MKLVNRILMDVIGVIGLAFTAGTEVHQTYNGKERREQL